LKKIGLQLSKRIFAFFVPGTNESIQEGLNTDLEDFGTDLVWEYGIFSMPDIIVE